jgi:hypothetical protein
MQLRNLRNVRNLRNLSGALSKLVEQRYFTELSAAGGQHYTIPTVTIGASDDFELEFTGEFSGLSVNRFVFGANTASSEDRAYFVTSEKSFRVRTATPLVLFTNTEWTFLTSGKLVTFKVRAFGSNQNEYWLSDGNGWRAGTNNAKSAFNIGRIGRRSEAASSIQDFNGYLSDVKISINGNLVRHYPLDDDGTTNVARELVSGADGARVNLTAASTELFTKGDDTWVNGDGTKVLEIAP